MLPGPEAGRFTPAGAGLKETPVNHAQLIALGQSLRIAGEYAQRLDVIASDTQEIRLDLERALALLHDAVTSAKLTTRCTEHPTGRVDPDATDLCRQCGKRRRSGQRIRPHSTGTDDAPHSWMQARYRIHADHSLPNKLWIPLMWNGQAWQMCGTPRSSEREVEQYLAQLRQSLDATCAYRPVYAFRDQQGVRAWGSETLTPHQPSGL